MLKKHLYKKCVEAVIFYLFLASLFLDCFLLGDAMDKVDAFSVGFPGGLPPGAVGGIVASAGPGHRSRALMIETVVLTKRNTSALTSDAAYLLCFGALIIPSPSNRPRDKVEPWI